MALPVPSPVVGVGSRRSSFGGLEYLRRDCNNKNHDDEMMKRLDLTKPSSEVLYSSTMSDDEDEAELNIETTSAAIVGRIGEDDCNESYYNAFLLPDLFSNNNNNNAARESIVQEPEISHFHTSENGGNFRRRWNNKEGQAQQQPQQRHQQRPQPRYVQQPQMQQYYQQQYNYEAKVTAKDVLSSNENLVRSKFVHEEDEQHVIVSNSNDRPGSIPSRDDSNSTTSTRFSKREKKALLDEIHKQTGFEKYRRIDWDIIALHPDLATRTIGQLKSRWNHYQPRVQEQQLLSALQRHGQLASRDQDAEERNGIAKDKMTRPCAWTAKEEEVLIELMQNTPKLQRHRGNQKYDWDTFAEHPALRYHTVEQMKAKWRKLKTKLRQRELPTSGDPQDEHATKKTGKCYDPVILMKERLKKNEEAKAGKVTSTGHTYSNSPGHHPEVQRSSPATKKTKRKRTVAAIAPSPWSQEDDDLLWTEFERLSKTDSSSPALRINERLQMILSRHFPERSYPAIEQRFYFLKKMHNFERSSPQPEAKVAMTTIIQSKSKKRRSDRKARKKERRAERKEAKKERGTDCKETKKERGTDKKKSKNERGTDNMEAKNEHSPKRKMKFVPWSVEEDNLLWEEFERQQALLGVPKSFAQGDEFGRVGLRVEECLRKVGAQHFPNRTGAAIKLRYYFLRKKHLIKEEGLTSNAAGKRKRTGKSDESSADGGSSKAEDSSSEEEDSSSGNEDSSSSEDEDSSSEDESSSSEEDTPQNEHCDSETETESEEESDSDN